MTSWVAVDSGIFLATVLSEPLTLKARALVKGWEHNQLQLVAPFLFHYEIVAVIRKHVYRGTITPDEGLQMRDQLLNYPIRLFSDELLLKRAYDLATIFNRPTAYDAQYLALAERLGCEFWTTDERLFNIVGNQLTWVKWLGNFKI